MTNATFCKGCVWEYDYDNCENDYKSNMIKNKDGSLNCGYCAWYKSKKMNLNVVV